MQLRTDLTFSNPVKCTYKNIRQLVSSAKKNFLEPQRAFLYNNKNKPSKEQQSAFVKYQQNQPL